MTLLEELLSESVTIMNGSHTFSYIQDNNEMIWDVYKFWDLVKSARIYTVPIAKFNKLFAEKMRDFSKDDWLRVKESNLNYPIILNGNHNDNDNLILDGYHRLLKAKQLNHQFITVQYIDFLPPPDTVIGTTFKVKNLKYKENT